MTRQYDGENLFDGPRLKVEWANRAIADYRAAFSSFSDSNKMTAVGRTDPYSGRAELNFGRMPLVPANLRLFAADALYNLRSALDQATCGSVMLVGKSPDGTYFPHGANRGGFEASLREKCQKVPERVRDAISMLRPYYGGNGYLLRVLHDLNLIDKHTELLAFDYALAKIHLEAINAIAVDVGPRAGDELEPPVSGALPVLRIDLAITVVFRGVETVRRQSATRVLLEMAGSVSEAVSAIEAATCRSGG